MFGGGGGGGGRGNPNIPQLEVPPDFQWDGNGGGGGGGSAATSTPPNKGGWNTDPLVAARTGWQYLTSIWEKCLDYFNQDARFDAVDFQGLLQGGIAWYDTRNASVGNRTVDSVVNNGDQTTLRAAVGSSDAVVLGNHTPNVALGRNYFQNNTQTQQVATSIHEALHIQMKFNDRQLKEWLMNFGFKPEQFGTGDISDWIAGGCN